MTSLSSVATSCQREDNYGTLPKHFTKDYELRVRERLELFRTSTKCQSGLVSTFVTTYGVADGIHSSIVNSEVTMDDLFEK